VRLQTSNLCLKICLYSTFNTQEKEREREKQECHLRLVLRTQDQIQINNNNNQKKKMMMNIIIYDCNGEFMHMSKNSKL